MQKKYMFSLLSLISIPIWFASSAITQAATINDAYISSVNIDSVSSSTLGGSSTYTITFVNSASLDADSAVYISFDTSSGCQAADYNTCSSDLSSATLSGLSGEKIDDGSTSTFGFLFSTALAAGTHTFTLSQVTNPTSAAAQRISMASTASDEETLLGDEFSQDNQYATSSNVALFGTPLISGLVVNVDGDVMPNVSVNIHTVDWSTYGSGATDTHGFYAIFQDYYEAGYWTAGELTATVYPNDNSGYLATDNVVTFDGSSPIETALNLDPSVYFFSGQVLYGSNTSKTTSSQPGDPITNATVYFSPVAGGSGYSANTDENGEYTVAVRPGTYYAQLSLDQSDENQDQDWVYEGGSETYTLSAVGTTTADIVATLTTAKLKGNITAPDGTTIILGTLSLSNSDHTYSASVDEDGTYILNLNPGTYTVSFYPYSSTGEDVSMYYYSAANLVVEEGKAEYDITLQEKTASAVVTVSDQDGNPLADVAVNASKPNDWSGGQTDANGQITVWLQAGETYQINPWKDGYIFSDPPTSVKVKDGQSKNISFTLYNPDASISVAVMDSDGNVVDSGFGYVNCNSTANTAQRFGGEIRNGAGTVYVLVGDSGVFTGTCNLWMNDESLGAATAQDVEVADGDTGQIEFTLIDRNAQITIYVKDNTGHLVKNASSGEVNVWNEKSNMWQGKPLDASGKTVIKVVPGTYNAGVWFEDSSYIPLWSKNNGTASVKADETGKIVLTVVKASAQVTGTVADPEGNAVEHGWVSCGNWEEVSVQGDFEGGEVIDSGAEVSHGEFTMALVAGHTYRCNVGAPPEFIDQGWLSPEDQTLEVNAEGTDVPNLTFEFAQADSKIKGTVTWPAQVSAEAKSSQHAWCWAWGEDGGHSYTETKSDGTFSIPVQSGGVWHYGCDSQDGETWLTTGDQEVDIPEATTISVSLDLKSFSAWKVYSPVSQTFDATESVVISLEDGTTVTIPANAIASSGQITVTATPESNIVYTGDQMLGIPWNFEAFVDGELVETFNADVTINIPYTNKTLNEFGVDEDSLVPKYYDETTGSWVTTDGVTQNKKTNTLTITTNHFTQYGVTFNQQLSSGLRPDSPDELSVSNRTTHSAQLAWTKGSTKKVTAYTLQVRVKNDKKQGHWTTYKSVSGLTKTAKKLNTNTDYQFRVKACNSGFCSSYSSWQNFKTQ